MRLCVCNTTGSTCVNCGAVVVNVRQLCNAPDNERVLRVAAELASHNHPFAQADTAGDRNASSAQTPTAASYANGFHEKSRNLADAAAQRGGPGFLEKVKNFATAAAGHVAAGMPMASDEEIIRRHDICLACEHLVDNACTQCGCPVSRVKGYVSKLSWADQECPIGKWGKVSDAK